MTGFAEEVAAHIERAIALFGHNHHLLHPDSGFAISADDPIATAATQRDPLSILAGRAKVTAAGFLICYGITSGSMAKALRKIGFDSHLRIASLK